MNEQHAGEVWMQIKRLWNVENNCPQIGCSPILDAFNFLDLMSHMDPNENTHVHEIKIWVFTMISPQQFRSA